ncbi:MAG: fused MFS/spermidine synthase [Planctomycetia bacterium]|nr:fused MFS/spermidine synthase [Planctomycetia bacterium]
MARYAITIFLSAFLLFQVQPLVGKFILPWFGGSPAVWTTCMLFFQVLLLAGYSYAHLVTSKLSPRAQTVCHVGLLAGSLVFLPIAPDATTWKPSGDEAPIGRILVLLTAMIGLPYFLLSSTGPLLQERFRRETGKTPYRLYSLSNVGSLLALLSYPFLFEPELTLQTQILGWSISYGLFALCCGWCVLWFSRSAHFVPGASGDESAPSQAVVPGDARPDLRHILLWLSLAACGSVMLLATTNQLCQEITSVPFLWVLPLALYLLTFIICFDHERWYHRNGFRVLLVAAVATVCYLLFIKVKLGIWAQLTIYSAALWVCCMVCHGELVRAKPAPKFATLFYLLVSAGGALGGILVALVAPLLLHDFWEYEIGLGATILLAVVAPRLQPRRKPTSPQMRLLLGGATSIALGAGITWGILEYQEQPTSTETNLETTRDFYGILRVNRDENPYNPTVGDANGPYLELIHGRIQHGFQYLDADKRRMATTYYGPKSGIGVALINHPRRSAMTPGERSLRVGVVGLGCGTLATYGEPGDTIRFYEINPEVIRISNEYFTFRKDSPAQVDIVLGDARIKMEQEISSGRPQRFDVLAVDAFSSDSIPMHLLTKQCVELYRQHLQSDGLLCLHISNNFLDLSGVTRGIAQALGYECLRIHARRDPEIGTNTSTWVILTVNREFLNSPAVQDRIEPWTQDDPPPLVWTDDYGSLWQVLDD